MKQLGSTGPILMKFDIWVFFFFRKSVGRIEVSLKSEKNKVYTLRENQYKFLGHNSLISS